MSRPCSRSSRTTPPSRRFWTRWANNWVAWRNGSRPATMSVPQKSSRMRSSRQASGRSWGGSISKRPSKNAPTVRKEIQDLEALPIDAGSIEAVSRPVLLTTGEKSPPMFAPVIEKLAEALPRVENLTFPDAGHIPHLTHPAAYVEATTAFIRKHEAQ